MRALDATHRESARSVRPVKSPLCQEVLRAREEFCRFFFDPDVPPDSAEGLRRYFFGFACAARLRHYRRGSGTTPPSAP